jgi:hypothetical protein
MVIIISIILEPVTNCIYNNWVTEHQFRRLQWILDGKLQLQRMTYECSGVGRLRYRSVGKPRVTSFDDTRHTWHPRTRTASRAACMKVNKQHRGWERKDGERHRGAAPPTRSNQG